MAILKSKKADVSSISPSSERLNPAEQVSRQIEGLNKDLQHVKRRNWRYYNVTRDENPQREEIYIPSFEGFHTQLDCKLTYGNKNQNTVDTRVVHIISCSKQNRTTRE